MSNTAVLYRMETDDHIPPYGLKSRDFLKRKGFEVEDHKLTTREETDLFKKEHSVEPTPQTFIEGERIGRYAALRQLFGMDSKEKDADDTSYEPVIAVFAVCFLMAFASGWTMGSGLDVIRTVELFIAYSICVLAILKLRDLYSSSVQFVTYVFKAVYIDKREVRCASVGGSSNVPMGLVSLTESLMMIGMVIWMIN